LIVKDYFLLCSNTFLLGLPGCLVFPHGVEHRQQLAHPGDQGHLRALPGRPEALRKRLEHRMVASRHQSAQREGRTSLGPPTPDRASTTQGAAVPMQGRETDLRGQVLAAQGASRWQIAHARPRTHGADPRHTAPEVLTDAPDRTGPPRRLEGIIEGREARVAPRDMGRASCLEAARRTPEAVLLRGPHGDAWPSSGQERPQRRRLRVRHWAGCGANRLRTVGQGTGVQGIGRGQLAGGLRAIAGLPWVDHDDGQRRCRQCGDGRALEPSGRFEHHQGRADPLSLRHQVGNTGIIVGHGPTGAGGAQGHIPMGFGPINTHKRLR
jgi:hypothetical protein